MTIATELARVIAGPITVYGGAEPADYAQARTYRALRLLGFRAATALATVKSNPDKTRYPAPDLASYQNAPNDRGGRWIEKPEMAGLRFVGWSDELCRGIDHTGWFDSPAQEEVYRGCVYQMPARDGKPIYVEAVRHGSGSRRGNWSDASGVDGSAILYFGERHVGAYCDDESAKRDAARGADREAELLAEAEREYHGMHDDESEDEE